MTSTIRLAIREEAGAYNGANIPDHQQHTSTEDREDDKQEVKPRRGGNRGGRF